mmetsp:Transcript_22395/g.43923  ORF Transcript_22395/g.43923 Transcript_22395/m.43923 type:complete len:420 (+) Transcript_22395:483-1742(+)
MLSTTDLHRTASAANRQPSSIFIRLARLAGLGGYLLAAYRTFKEMQNERQQKALLKCWCSIGMLHYAGTLLPSLQVLETSLVLCFALSPSPHHSHCIKTPPAFTNQPRTRADILQMYKVLNQGELTSMEHNQEKSNFISVLFEYMYRSFVSRCFKIYESASSRVYDYLLDALRILLINWISRMLNLLSKSQLREFQLTLRTSLLLLKQERSKRKHLSTVSSKLLNDDEEEISAEIPTAQPLDCSGRSSFERYCSPASQNNYSLNEEQHYIHKNMPNFEAIGSEATHLWRYQEQEEEIEKYCERAGVGILTRSHHSRQYSHYSSADFTQNHSSDKARDNLDYFEYEGKDLDENLDYANDRLWNQQVSPESKLEKLSMNFSLEIDSEEEEKCGSNYTDFHTSASTDVHIGYELEYDTSEML